MRIVYLSASAFPAPGRANSIQVMNMCAAFAQMGHEVVVVAPDHTERLKDVDPHAYYGTPAAFRIEHLRWIP